MTVQNFRSNFSKFGAYFAYKFRSLRTLVILNSIFALLSYPLAMAVIIPFSSVSVRMDELEEIPGSHRLTEYIALREQRDSLESLMIASFIICVVMLAAMFLMNYVFVNKSFRWLYNKSVVDMDYSLPVSDDTRFFGDLLASLTGSLLPHLAAIGLGSALYWALPFKALEAPHDEVSAVFGIGLQLAFTGVTACVMFMGICLLVMSFCGRAVESRIMPFVVNLVIPAIHAVCIAVLVQGIYGYHGNSTYEYNSIGLTSPLGLLYMSVYAITNDYSLDITTYRTFMFRPENFLPLLLIMILCFAAAYLLIRIRRSERVGAPYVYPVVKTVLHSVIIFAIVSLFMFVTRIDTDDPFSSMDPELAGPYVGMIVLTFIVFVIMELISGKGFKKFHITMLRYVITMAVSVCICLGLYYSQGLGFARVIPDREDVTSVRVYFEYDYNHGQDQLPENFEEMNRLNLNYVTIDTPEEIDLVIDVHNQMPKRQSDATGNRYSTFRVQYNLKGGSVLSRQYSITDEEFLAAAEKLMDPEIYYRSKCEDLRWLLVDEDLQPYTDRRIESVHTDKGVRTVNISAEEFMDALRRDSQLVSLDVVSAPDNKKTRVTFRVYCVYGSGTANEHAGWSMCDFEIWSWQKNVIDLLEEQGAGDILFSQSDSGEKAMLLRLPADDLLLQGEADNLYLGNIILDERDDRPDFYNGDYGYSVSGNGEVIPGGTFEMIDPDMYTSSVLMLAEAKVGDYLVEIESYDQYYVYAVAYIDMGAADENGVITVDVDRSLMLVPQYNFWTAETIFDELQNSLNPDMDAEMIY